MGRSPTMSEIPTLILVMAAVEVSLKVPPNAVIG